MAKTENKLNKSLEDLIAEARKAKPATRGRQPGAPPKKGVRVGPGGSRAPVQIGRPAGRGNAARDNQSGPSKKQVVTVNLSSVRRGGVLKRGGPTRGATFAQPRHAPYTANANPGTGKWGHDLYQTQQHLPPVVEVPRGPVKTTNKLFISNLHYNVSEDDIRELFGVVGSLREYRIHFDSSGRSLGTAHVTFEPAEDALAALTKYNNVALDGSKMRIELVEAPPPPPGTIQTLSSGINVQVVQPSSGRGRGSYSGRGGGFSGRGGGGGRRGGGRGGGYGGVPDSGDYMQE